MVYVPFGRTRLFQRVGERPLPAWAADFDAGSWAQFFIKYALGHPAVTVVTPATSSARHMVDNLGGGIGRLPDAATRKRMAEFVDALPQLSPCTMPPPNMLASRVTSTRTLLREEVFVHTGRGPAWGW